MDRYHINVYFPEKVTELLPEFCRNLNYSIWSFSDHYYENLFEESPTMARKIKEVLLSYWFDEKEVFEVYLNKDIIEKACFRTKFTPEEDLIFVVTRTKKLVTFYRNDTDDHHKSLVTVGYIKEPTC